MIKTFLFVGRVGQKLRYQPVEDPLQLHAFDSILVASKSLRQRVELHQAALKPLVFLATNAAITEAIYESERTGRVVRLSDI